MQGAQVAEQFAQQFSIPSSPPLSGPAYPLCLAHARCRPVLPLPACPAPLGFSPAFSYRFFALAPPVCARTMQALREASLFPLVSSPPCSFPWGPSGALDLSSLSAALFSPPLSVRTLHHALQFAGTLHNTHLVHPLRLWPAVSHAEPLLLSSSLWPPAATIAPIRVPGRRSMARNMHYTVRCHPIPTTCYPASPVSSPSPS